MTHQMPKRQLTRQLRAHLHLHLLLTVDKQLFKEAAKPQRQQRQWLRHRHRHGAVLEVPVGEALAEATVEMVSAVLRSCEGSGQSFEEGM